MKHQYGEGSIEEDVSGGYLARLRSRELMALEDGQDDEEVEFADDPDNCEVF